MLTIPRPANDGMRVDYIIPPKGENISMSFLQESINHKVLLKERSQGPKTQPWMTWLYKKLLTDFDKLTAKEKFFPKILIGCSCNGEGYPCKGGIIRCLVQSIFKLPLKYLLISH